MARLKATARRGLMSATLVTLAACGGDGKTLRDTVFDPPARVEETVPTTQPTIAPAQPSAVAGSSDAAGSVAQPADGRVIVFDQLHSPANATAEVVGTGALVGDPVTVDGKPADVLKFEPAPDGSFVAQVWIEDQGAHTVCIADTCGRVYTLAPDADSPEEVTAKIEAALPLAAEVLDYENEFPDWTVEIGGALAGTGGTVDIDTKTVTVYRNRGREIDDFVRTVLHEFGHVADFERLDDTERARYMLIRGIDPKQPWRSDGNHRLEDWATQPSEDFAETMVMLWSDGRWTQRTFDPAAMLTADQLAEISAMTEPSTG